MMVEQFVQNQLSLLTNWSSTFGQTATHFWGVTKTFLFWVKSTYNRKKIMCYFGCFTSQCTFHSHLTPGFEPSTSCGDGNSANHYTTTAPQRARSSFSIRCLIILIRRFSIIPTSHQVGTLNLLWWWRQC
jgi:hypothetical protein